MMRLLAATGAAVLILGACSSTEPAETTATSPSASASASAASSSVATEPASDAAYPAGSPSVANVVSGDSKCGSEFNPAIVRTGYNEVVDASGTVLSPQGKPLQVGDTLEAVETEITEQNEVAYAQVTSYMIPIRNALMCNIDALTNAQWTDLTSILTVNDIKTKQDLSGTPKDQVYSTQGIYELLKAGPEEHPMMKYLEESELSLKCLDFVGFDFTNPEGDNQCQEEGLKEGTMKLP
jgi:hypothetical protein